MDALDVKGTGGDEVATITVTVWDAAGQPVPNGTSVTLTATSGTFSNGQSSYTRLTGSNGAVSFTYQSGTTSGTVTFTAVSGTATGSAALITVASGPADSILLGYDTAATTPVNGISTVTISALVADTYGNAVATGSQVFFEIIVGGSGNAVITPVAMTDETGLAEATLSYPDTEIGNTINVQVSCDGVVQTILVTLP